MTTQTDTATDTPKTPAQRALFQFDFMLLMMQCGREQMAQGAATALRGILETMAEDEA